jgi:hypothetical protein
VRALIIETRAKGFAIAGRVGDRGDCPIDGKQAHPFPEGLRSPGRGFRSCQAGKEFLQQFAAQLAAPITESRLDWDLLGHIVAHGSQSTHQFAIDPALLKLGVQMQSNQPIDDDDHIRFVFALFPHLIGL